MGSPTLRRMDRPGLVLQHDADVPPALFADWLEARGIAWELIDVGQDGVPTRDRPAWIAVLGSHSSAAATEPAWVPAEADLMAAAIRAEVPLLGICFAAQALALALGGEVGPTPVPEASWDAEIEVLDELIPAGPWLNLHFESFTLPPGAELLASGGRAVGLSPRPAPRRPVSSRGDAGNRRRVVGALPSGAPGDRLRGAGVRGRGEPGRGPRAGLRSLRPLAGGLDRRHPRLARRPHCRPGPTLAAPAPSAMTPLPAGTDARR
jgi:GMP synthase-like glutamine amidotransferase